MKTIDKIENRLVDPDWSTYRNYRIDIIYLINNVLDAY